MGTVKQKGSGISGTVGERELFKASVLFIVGRLFWIQAIDSSCWSLTLEYHNSRLSCGSLTIVCMKDGSWTRLLNCRILLTTADLSEPCEVLGQLLFVVISALEIREYAATTAFMLHVCNIKMEHANYCVLLLGYGARLANRTDWSVNCRGHCKWINV